MAELVRMRASLRSLVTRVHGTAVEITHASGEIAQGNADLSSRTESQARLPAMPARWPSKAARWWPRWSAP